MTKIAIILISLMPWAVLGALYFAVKKGLRP